MAATSPPLPLCDDNNNTNAMTNDNENENDDAHKHAEAKGNRMGAQVSKPAPCLPAHPLTGHSSKPISMTAATKTPGGEYPTRVLPPECSSTQARVVFTLPPHQWPAEGECGPRPDDGVEDHRHVT